MKRIVVIGAAVALAGGLLAAQTKPAAKPLEIYIVDVEGGKANLFVTPSGQTVLVDTGFTPQGTVHRDVDRDHGHHPAAGVTKLDYLLSTHYHVDHVGGLQELVTRIPVGDVPRSRSDARGRRRRASAGTGARLPGGLRGDSRQGQAHRAEGGRRIPLTGVDWRIVTSGGVVQKTALAGCARRGPREPGVRRRHASGRAARSRQRRVGGQR